LHRRLVDIGGRGKVVIALLLVALSQAARLRYMRCFYFSDSEYVLYAKSFVSTVGVATTLVVSWIFCQEAQICGAELDEALLKRFQTEAPKAWKKQVELHKRFFSETTGVTIDSKQKVFRKGKIQLDEYHEKRIRYNYRQMISHDLSRGERTTECANPRYAFELASSASGESVITGVYPYLVATANVSDNKDAYNRIMEPQREIRPQMLPIQEVLNQIDWLSEAVRVQDIKSISVNNRECVEVNIEFPYTYLKENAEANKVVKKVFSSSSVGIFDPLNDWVLISFVWMGEPPFKMTYTYSYDETLGGIHFMTSTRRETRNMTTNTVIDEINYQRSVSVAELSEKDFTLSAFGFPEPTLDKPPPYWLYSSLGGLILVIIGGLLYQWGVGLRRS